MILRSLTIACLALAQASTAEPRTWKSEDGRSSFAGEFLSVNDDLVSIRRSDGKVFDVKMEKLHPSDHHWITSREQPAAPAPDPVPTPNAVFDTLCFGDSRAQVEEKLKASNLLECTVDPNFLGRVGLNGVFRTKQRIGGLQCELYFDWTPAGKLKELTLQSESMEAPTYQEQLHQNWIELAKLMTTLNGKPLQAADYPKEQDLQNDLLLASHLWRLRGGGSAILGTSMLADKYLVVVRFTSEKIDPVRTP